MTSSSARHSAWLPGLAGVAGLAAAIVVWQLLVGAERRQITYMSEARVQTAAQRLDRSLQALSGSLVGIAQRHGTALRGDRSWEIQLTGLVVTLWVEPSGRVAWVTPRDGNEEFVNADLTLNDSDRSALLKAGETGKPSIAREIALPRGDSGLHIVVPVRGGDRLEGFLVGVFSTAAIYPLVFQDDIAEGWALAVLEDDRESWRHGSAGEGRWLGESRATVLDSTFRIRAAPGPAILARMHNPLPGVVLGAGAAIALLLAAALHFAESARRRAREAEQAQQKLHSQLARLNLLDQIARAIGERQDLRSILQVVIRNLEDHLPIDFGAVCTYDEAQEALSVTCVGAKSQSLALELALPERSRIGIDQNGLSRCVRGELVHEPDTRLVEFPFAQRLARRGLYSLVMAPLLVESTAFGVLVAARREVGGFSSGDCEFLRGLSGHVALAAHQAQLYGALEEAYEDLRQTQQAVMQQERLRALGQMASGIAHDINNAISPVVLYTESLLEKEPNLSARARGYLEIIQRAIDDVAQTVGRMREFYRHREPQMALAPVQVNRLIQHVTDLTRARWSDMPQQRGAVIELVSELEPDLPAVMGVESEIREALVNLVFNAIDAMPDGGTLTLRTRSNEAGAGSHGEEAPRSVRVEVSDTGVGMDEDTRRRCVEPFFTTKGNQGTGLGLAMVYGVIERHSGEIDIISAPGSGTTVRLTLPVPAGAVAAVEGVVFNAAPSRLRILVVDDDPLVLKSLGDALEAEGHVVVAANHGQAGIDAFLEAHGRGEAFEVVITDLGMPHIDGRQVARAVKAASSSTPVLLLTGWGQRLAAEGDVPVHVDHVLSKPPKMRELRRVLANYRGSLRR